MIEKIILDHLTKKLAVPIFMGDAGGSSSIFCCAGKNQQQPKKLHLHGHDGGAVICPGACWKRHS